MAKLNKRDKLGTNGKSADALAVVGDLSSPNFFLPFFHYLTIPKNTPIASPVIYQLPLPKGMVHKIWVEFPRGCSGLAGFQIWRTVSPVFPLPEGVWLRSDNSILNFAFSHIIADEPYSLVLKGYNLDDTYDHTIWFAAEMRGLQADLPPQLQGLIDFITNG